VAEAPQVRRSLRPGDLGEIVALHGRLYATEYGLSPLFESDLAAGIARAVEAGWPESNGGVWLADHEGRVAASMAVTFESEQEARLRWVVVDPALRGQGLARRMLSEVVETTAASGRTLISFDTFSELTTAARMYREAGFAVTEERPWTRWGRELTLQRYERRSGRA
jgi:ribosomal protein S18 acetylase RimI-like enzyme